MRLFLLLSLVLYSSRLLAQKEVVEQSQHWIGYMTSSGITEKISWWNDFHYVPGGFFVLRTGLTYHFPGNVNVTAGYGFLGLPAGGVNNELKRREHRPWGQLVLRTSISDRWSHIMRIRYDARFRQRIQGQELAEGYIFNHRVRLLTSFRRTFPSILLWDKWRPFYNISNEVLLNFGKPIIYNHLDQNRITFTVGIQRPGLSVQTGYMNRYVVVGAGNRLVMNHTLIVWVIHSLDGLRRLVAPIP